MVWGKPPAALDPTFTGSCSSAARGLEGVLTPVLHLGTSCSPHTPAAGAGEPERKSCAASAQAQLAPTPRAGGLPYERSESAETV